MSNYIKIEISSLDNCKPPLPVIKPILPIVRQNGLAQTCLALGGFYT